MARIEQGILGPFRGTVGTVIGYRWRDRWCMRAKPREYHDRQSATQLQQRSRFKAMIQFASPATPLLRIGLRAWAEEHTLTEGNAFLKINHQNFQNNQNDQNTTDLRIAYSCLRFSHGHLPAVRLTEGTVDEGGVATVQWNKEGGRNEDRLHLYAYCPAAGTGLLVATVERGRRRARFLLPQQMLGSEVHLWAVAENAAGEVSPTAYIRLADDSTVTYVTPDTPSSSETADCIPCPALVQAEGTPESSTPAPLPADQATGHIPKTSMCAG